jgi:hypothetical protein
MKCVGASYIKHSGIEWVKAYCNGDETLKSSYYSPRNIDRVTLHKFVTLLEPFLSKELQMRFEGSHANIYTNDVALVDQIEDVLKDFIKDVYEPASHEEAEFLKGKNNAVICDIIPYGKYTHKVVLKDKIPHDRRIKFYTWISKYDEDTVKIGKSTLGFINGSKSYVQAPFLYVSNAKFLTMISLQIGEHVQRIEEFVPRHTLLL